MEKDKNDLAKRDDKSYLGFSFSKALRGELDRRHPKFLNNEKATKSSVHSERLKKSILGN